MKVKPIAVLYAVYLAFFFSIFFRSNESAISEYVSTMFGLMCIFLLILQNGIKTLQAEWQRRLFIFFALVFGIFCCMQLHDNNSYTVALYLKVMLFIWFFSVFEVDRQDFILFINRTYLLYLLVATLLWSGLVPNTLFEYVDTEEFRVNLGFLHYGILYGVEGSPATIDSYSSLVLLINLFMYSGSHRKFYLAASLFGVLASFRLTPLVAVFAVFALYPFYKNRRYLSSLILVSISALFVAVLLAVGMDGNMSIFGSDVDMRMLAYSLTHARSMIWEQQLSHVMQNFTWVDYIFGHFSVAEFSVPTFQLDGSDSGAFESNPHNNYLLLFYRSPFLFIAFYFVFIFCQHRNFSKENFPILFFIFLAGFMNSSLISLGNPIFLMFITYVLVKRNFPERISMRHVAGTDIK
ncbi:hypothetical protein [Janthinobacterium agaricidamnosum]|uniref:Putative membrane protein n=1 Tax=Janthinobacterium agaricidamnosum NBRC 102515 = DSM 9628 TaxID=1349767 RepID=W0V147_9BURK|nr:hypothetical protein [Janthinobacterium agaricidamnosum]CDG81596.1 putative membrane protein [Janthinobacterium agaricidamnosum NBRC 102515 = DSM 9628]